MNARDIAEIRQNFQKGLYTGAAELILLSIVSQAGDRLYGYQIAKVIGKDETEVPIVKLGTLYPVLRSLEADGLLESQVDPSVSGPPRRYYRVTPLGRAVLGQLREAWAYTKTFVDNILTGASDDK
jgi:PadR family transcriptional regulator, regulatory protein PadR